MNITNYILNLLRKKQKNTVEIDNELKKEIDTLKQLINTVKKNTEITYEKIDKVKEIINELKRQTNYTYPICLNKEIDLSEIDD